MEDKNVKDRKVEELKQIKFNSVKQNNLLALQLQMKEKQ